MQGLIWACALPVFTSQNSAGVVYVVLQSSVKSLIEKCCYASKSFCKSPSKSLFLPRDGGNGFKFFILNYFCSLIVRHDKFLFICILLIFFFGIWIGSVVPEKIVVRFSRRLFWWHTARDFFKLISYVSIASFQGVCVPVFAFRHLSVSRLNVSA